ncbi:hypothetical protein [Mesonia aquimarina]|uniref:hypothetical protein n=1 Tax=Mesonia aquimarina TaxID=1504967 RepID=UPI000EF60B35|nr:hypothetical protein [Mesonia aquimarina]
MKNITATYKNRELTFIKDGTSTEIGKIIYGKNKQPRLILDENEYSIVRTSKNEIQIFKNNEKIDSLNKDKIFGNYQFKNSTYQIKGISSWKGGTKLVDKENETILSIQNKSSLLDKGIYNIQLNNKVDSLFILLSLHIHIEASKTKTLAAVVSSSIASLFVVQKFIFPHFN